MSAAEEADELVCKVRAGRASANDALRILNGLEELAKPEEAEAMKRARAVLEDRAATENALAVLKFHRKKALPGAGQQLGRRMERRELRIIP